MRVAGSVRRVQCSESKADGECVVVIGVWGEELGFGVCPMRVGISGLGFRIGGLWYHFHSLRIKRFPRASFSV